MVHATLLEFAHVVDARQCSKSSLGARRNNFVGSMIGQFEANRARQGFETWLVDLGVYTKPFC